MIEVANLHKVFVNPAESVTVLGSVSFAVGAGECVGLTGASGSGKSTLLNILAGLETADEGRVTVAGVDVTSAYPQRLADMRLREVGVVFQDHNLVPDFTVGENVEVVLRAQGLSGREARAQAQEALARVGVEELAARRPAEISGGQAQRVGIARALAGDKRVILADEPTGSLDQRTSATIFELLLDLAEDGTTILVCTHDALVGRYTHRQIRLENGHLR